MDVTTTQAIPRRHVGVFLLLAVGVSSLDLWTKHWVFRRADMFHGTEWWLWKGHFGVQKSLNEGALFGIGQGQVALFAVFSAIAFIAIPLWLFYFRAAEDRLLTSASGCIMGGILGNLYDRLGLAGLTWDDFQPHRQGERVYAVRDWILCQWNPQWVWPNYNIADAALVLGAGLLMVHSFRRQN